MPEGLKQAGSVFTSPFVKGGMRGISSGCPGLSDVAEVPAAPPPNPLYEWGSGYCPFRPKHSYRYLFLLQLLNHPRRYRPVKAIPRLRVLSLGPGPDTASLGSRATHPQGRAIDK